MSLRQIRKMPEFKPEETNIRSSLIEAFTASSGMWLFALFVHSTLPLVLLSGIGLLVTGLTLVQSLRAESWSIDVFGFAPFTKTTAAYIIFGCAIGAVFGITYRVSSDMGVLPEEIERFMFVAASIGAAEEVLFRGYVQGKLRCLNWVVAVVFAALAHTLYKLALFALPPEGILISYKSFAILTFTGGMVYGVLRELSGNILPPLVGHVIFDVIVYGDNINAPWWVWS